MNLLLRWKKKQFIHKVNKKQQNILTFNQTVAIKVCIVTYYYTFKLALWMLPQQQVLLFEMFTVIFIDNICFRCLVPIVIYINTKRMFPELWYQKSNIKRTIFYMTELEKVPRRPNIFIQSETTGQQYKRKKRKFVYVKPAV